MRENFARCLLWACMATVRHRTHSRNPSRIRMPGIASSALMAIAAFMLPACTCMPASNSVKAPQESLPDGLHWYRDSAERKAIYVEIYRAAAASAASLSKGYPPHAWGVILDVDETLLDNSKFQKRLAVSGQKYSFAIWDAWVREKQATALPGARDFLNSVLDELQGQVILVTNRSQRECATTEDNLHAVQLRYSRILCAPDGVSDKNERFSQVQTGEPGGNQPIRVVLWIGDNIQDFPNLSQSAMGDTAAFGVKYFSLPNPMYGSWVSVPAR